MNYQDDYLDWVNNYLTIELFAEHRDWSVNHARDVLEKGKAIHEKLCFEHKIDNYIVDVMAGKHD